VLAALPGLNPIELADSAEKSFCCGGGGSHFWIDLREGERLNRLRVEQARQVGADIIATACPYCHQMLEDATKLLDPDDRLQVKDIAGLARELTRTLVR